VPAWLVALDDALCCRLTTCSLCGCALGNQGAHTEIRTIEAWHHYVMLCVRCHHRDARRVHLDALLRARYGAKANIL
jgi:hypothetical protein